MTSKPTKLVVRVLCHSILHLIVPLLLYAPLTFLTYFCHPSQLLGNIWFTPRFSSLLGKHEHIAWYTSTAQM